MKLKRVLSLLLAMVMTVSLLTLPVHAEGNDFASLTVAEQYAALKSADNEAEAQALFDTLTEQQQTALVTYAQTQAEQEYTVPQTVVFTEAGPFMPPVNVAPVRMKTMARAAVVPAEDDGNGLVFTKKAKDNKDGTYTITMEAYTTGKVTTSTTTAPVDIVLVLDQSGSMAFDFDGNEYASYENSRQYAMKQAVNNFIDKVNEKYSAEADHRMAIVTFGSNASTLQGWTVVNEAGKTTLQGKISGLPNSPSGATNVAAGMTQAETLMGSGYSYTGSNTDRQKVVIVFTDGVPTTASDFDTTVATNAIASAKTLKDAGATVYTVGIFTGANPNELYGASGFDTNSDGSIGSKWVKDTWGLFPGTDFPEADRPAGNRFLNYLSSNYPDAMSIGLNRSTSGLGILHYKITYEIKNNYTNAASNYYLTANNNASLNSIFQTISENIQTANIDLGIETVVKDKISPYFTAPVNASAIKLYTAAAKSDGTFEDGVAAPSTVKATVEGDTVSVTGFDFNANFVSSTQKSDKTYGKKLIIEFTVTPRDGFLGGNNVPTNGEAAVYDKDGALVEAEVTPYVNVPIKDVTVSAQDKNVYLLHTMTDEECKTGATATCNGVNLLDETAYTGENAWKAKFVTITTNITKPTDAMTDDTTYTIDVTVKPNTNGTGADGTPNSMDGKSGVNAPAAKINVFKPELTFKDSEVYYGDTAPENYNGNKVSEQWKHGDDVDSAVTMTGEKPTLVLTYTPGTGIADGIIKTTKDIPVAVTAQIDSTDVTSYVTFKHDDCNPVCGWNEATSGGDFLLHVKTCTLTITKSGCDTAKDAYQSFIFNVSGPKSMQVTVQENGTATIVGLPVGDYTVTEDGDWSWRYKADGPGKVTLSAAKHTDTVTITNQRTATKWLSGDNYAVNHVGGIKARGTFVAGN
ncbi:MAG: VWA domain-containing protein [Clostridiales bacterium]|nr:VWA domain-containing protein [Clostridiales bacterium]